MKVFDRLSKLVSWPKAKDKHLPKGKYVPDNRPESVVQRQEKELIAGSPRTAQQQQRFAESLENVQANNNGLPDTLRAGLENLSGLDLSPVRVHYNSSQPAQYKALAYAQGTEIHLAPGQQQYLPHEGWHVVQQMQQKVKPTHQFTNGRYLNNQTHLEREADEMGAKAVTAGRTSGFENKPQLNKQPIRAASDHRVSQMKFIVNANDVADSTKVRELTSGEIAGIKSKLADNAAALKVFENEMIEKSYHIVEHQGTAEANIDYIIKFCRDEAARKAGSAAAAPTPTGESKATSPSAGATSPSSGKTTDSEDKPVDKKAWKQGLHRKKQKGADGMGVQPELNEEQRARGHRGGRRHANAEKKMTQALGEEETKDFGAHIGHLIGHRLGGGDGPENKAVTTTLQEKWQKSVEVAVANALRDGPLTPQQVRLKVTAYTIPGSKDVAKALRIKVLLHTGTEGFVKMIDVTTTHECEVEPDASVYKKLRKVLDDWGSGNGNVYDWVRIHDGYAVKN